jgi:hypothetical protein
MKIILHIGTHKTGTTALQKFLLINSKSLIDGGVLYPSFLLGESTNQFSYLATLIKNKKTLRVKQIFSTMKEEALAKECHSILISGEEFSTLDDKSVEVLGKLLSELNLDVEVKLYLRNIYDFVVSAFVQINKLSTSLSKIHHLNRRLTRLVDYDGCLSRWCHVFSEDAVYVYSYDKYKADIIAHFLGLLPLEQPIKDMLIKESNSEIYLSINSTVDPLVSFIVSIMGHLSNPKDYDLLRKVCTELDHSDRSSLELQTFLSKTFVDAKGGEYKHSKILPIRELIVPDVDINLNSVFSNFNSGEYMYLLGKLLMVLSLEYGQKSWLKNFSSKSKLETIKNIL